MWSVNFDCAWRTHYASPTARLFRAIRFRCIGIAGDSRSSHLFFFPRFSNLDNRDLRRQAAFRALAGCNRIHSGVCFGCLCRLDDIQKERDEGIT